MLTPFRPFSRRDVLSSLAVSGAATPPGAPKPTSAALSGNLQVVPLPFVAGALRGLSKRLIRSHDTLVLRAVRMANHTRVLPTSIQPLAMDMYEHSYPWDDVNRRFERADKGAALLRGS